MKNSTSTFATTSSAANNKASSSAAAAAAASSSSSRQKRRQQEKDTHDGSDDYDIWTFTFKRKERNVQVSRWFREKALEKSMMNGQLVYNIVAMPAFIFWHAGFPDMVNGNFGLIGQVFIACVMLVHLSFFALYWLDMRYNHLGLDTKHQPAREQFSHWRMATLNFFVVTALSVNGLIMNTDIPATYNFPFSYRSKAAGLITFEPFVISCFLSVYHHHTYPISWEVVVFAWLVEFVLLVNSWVWICTPQSLVTNMVLTLVYACVLGVHHTVHVYKLDACLAELRRSVCCSLCLPRRLYSLCHLPT